MKYLVDSDWVVDYLGGRQAAVVFLSTIAEEGLAVKKIMSAFQLLKRILLIFYNWYTSLRCITEINVSVSVSII